MYRAAANRLLHGQLWSRSSNRISYLAAITNKSVPFTTSFNDQIPNVRHLQSQPPDFTYVQSSSSGEASAGAGEASSMRGEARAHDRRGSGREYQDEQTRVLQASLQHVLRLGWTEAAMISGARQAGLSPSIVGSFPRKEAAIVEFFMDDCLQRLIDEIDSNDAFKNLILSERISKLVRIRLEMQAPYISKWPEALSIQAQPLNIPTSFKQRAMLVDEIWHAVGDDASDLDWYVKRTILGGIYSSTELYMLTDSSPGFRDTWKFLDDRVRDAFDLKKTIQEAKYLAQAVGAGMGGSLEGFMKKAFQ